MEQVDIQNILNDARILIEEGKKSLQELYDINNTLVIGNTRAGKSTFINYMLGNKIEAKRLNSTGLGQAGRRLIIIKSDKNEDGPVIGQKNQSETKVCQKWDVRQQSIYKNCIWDNPGQGDNRGVQYDISNSYLIQQLLNSPNKKFKLVLLCDFNDIRNQNPANLINFLKSLNYLFGKSIINFYDAIILVVSKVDTQDYTVEEIVEDLKNIDEQIIDPSFDKNLLKHIIKNQKISIFYNPIKEGPVDFDNARKISESITNLCQFVPSQQTKIGISKDTQLFLLENRDQLHAYIDKELEILRNEIKSLITVGQFNTSSEAERQFEKFKEIERELHSLLWLNDLQTYIEQVISIIQKYKGNKINSEDILKKVEMISFVNSLVLVKDIELSYFKNKLIIKLTNSRSIIKSQQAILSCHEGKNSQEIVQQQIQQIQTSQTNTKEILNNNNKAHQQLQNHQTKEIIDSVKNNNNQLNDILVKQEKQNQEMKNNFWKSILKVVGQILIEFFKIGSEVYITQKLVEKGYKEQDIKKMKEEFLQNKKK